MRKEWRLPVLLFLLGTAGYLVLARIVFRMPNSLAEAEACGFTASDFAAGGQLSFTPTQAWWVSFLRMQEYFSAISIGLVFAFGGFAVAKIRQIGAAAASGAVAGGGVLAVLSLCLSCLAPALSAIGLGLFTSHALDIPKWLMALNTAVLTAWGFMFLSRRANGCPVITTGAPTEGCETEAKP